MTSSNPVFLTGSTGFIGSHLLRRLLKEDYTVHITVRAGSNVCRVADIIDQCVVHRIDLVNHSEVTSLIKEIQPQTFFHLAAYGVDYNQQDELKAIDININASINLFNSFTGDTFIHTGSAHEYGPLNRPLIETDPIQPSSLYGKTKATSIQQLTQLNETKDITLIIIRPFGIYGPSEGEHKFFPELIKKLSQDQTVDMTFGGQVRDYLFVSDLIDAYLKALQINTLGIFNVGSGRGYTLNEIAVKIAKTVGADTDLLNFGAIPYRLGESMYSVANINKIRKVMRWEPKTSLDEGLRKMVINS